MPSHDYNPWTRNNGYWKFLPQFNSTPPTPAPSIITTFDPAKKGAAIVLSGGNLSATNTLGQDWKSVLTTTSKTTGLFYIEFLIDVVAAGNEVSDHFGFALNNQNLESFLSAAGDAGFVRAVSGSAGRSGIVTLNAANLPSPYNSVAGNVIAFAMNFTTGQGWVAQNNNYGTGNPAAGTNPGFTWTTGGAWFMGWGCTALTANAATTIRATSASQSFAPPAGFAAWG